MSRWLAVIGIGEDGMAGLSAAARALIETAQLLVGGARHLAILPAGSAERLVWEKPLGRSVERIVAARGRRVAVLASGDPSWYGVAATLARHIPVEEMTIVPQPGAFSLAAARLGWPLAECALLSLHGRPLDGLRLALAPRRRILALSEDGGTPPAVARLLTELGWGASRLAVFEHLGGAREALYDSKAAEWGERRAAALNTIAIDCVAGPGARPLPLGAGLPDDAFENDGQLTKREVRAATLAALAPLYGECLWDVGAGSGSIAIEWLRGGEGRSAVAVEHDPARAVVIARNAAALGVPQLRIVAAAAPQALAGLPAPDAVFIGGGLAADGVLAGCWDALHPGGRLVANAVTIAGERVLLDWQTRKGGDLIRIAVSRAATLGAHRAWRPLLPVTQFAATKLR